MECNHCRRDSILFQPYSGQHLCARHFTLDVERRAKRVIRKSYWICSGDRIAVAANGDAPGMALLHFLVSTFGARRDLSFFIATTDPAIRNVQHASDPMLQKYGLEQVRAPMEAVLRTATGEPVREKDGQELYRTLRQRCIQQMAQEYHATKIAVGSTLDDEAWNMVSDVLQGDISRLHPSAGEGTIPCIRPFITVPEREVVLYAYLHTGIWDSEDIYRPLNGTHSGFRAALEEFTSRHPATPFALAHLRATLIQPVRKTFMQSRNRPGEDISRGTDVTARQKESPHAV
jgi:tRNA(Ile)-lysidine synthase TilS/MesJ